MWLLDIIYQVQQHIILTFQYCFHFLGVLWLNMSYEIGKITPKIWGKGTYICIGKGANEGPNFREWESWYETQLEVFTLEDLYFNFLAHLSQRLKWAFLIKICLLSVVVFVVVVVVVNFSHFHLLLQNNLAQSILGWRGFKFVQMKGPTLFQGEIITK